MAIRNNKINTKVTVDASGASKSTTKFFSDVKKGQQDVTKSSKNASKSLGKVGDAASKAGGKGATAFGGLTKSIGAGLSGAIGRILPMFGALKTAIISTGIGALVVAVGTLIAGISTAISKGAEFGKALSSLKGISGASALELGKLSDQAKALGASTAFTASQVVELQTELAKLGFTAEEVGQATPSILDLAASLDTSLAEAAEFAGSTVRAFGLDTSETQRVVDVMAASATKSAQSFESMKESFKLAAPTARALGVTVEETGALLGALANNGLKGSIAGTGLSKVFIQLAKEGKTLEEGLTEVRESSDQLNTAVDLVGIIGAKSLLTLANAGEDIAFLTAELEAAEGAANKLAETKLDNLAGDTTKLASAWEGFILSLEDGSGILNQIARSIVQAATAFLGFITDVKSGSEALEETRLELFKNQDQLRKYEKTLQDTEASEIELARAKVGRRDTIRELQKQYPDFLANMDAEKVTTEELNEAIMGLNESMVNKIIIQQQDEAIAEQAADTADALRDKLEAEAEVATRAAEARKLFSDAGIEITASDPQEAIAEMSEAFTQLYKEGNTSSSTMSDIRSKVRSLQNGLATLKDAEGDYNEEAEIGNGLLDEKNALLEQLGMKVEETSQAEKDAAAQAEADRKAKEQADKEAADRRKKAQEEAMKQREKDAKTFASLSEKAIKDAEDLQDDTEQKKIERQRERAQAELDDLKVNEEAKQAIRDQIDANFDEKQLLRAEKEKEAADKKAEQDKALQDKKDADAEKKRQDALAQQIELEALELERQLMNDTLTYDERIKLQQDFEERKKQLTLDNANLTATQREIIEEQSAQAQIAIAQQEADAKKKSQQAILDQALNGAAEAFGIAQEIGVAKMIMAAPEAVAGSFKEAAKAYAPPLSLAMGALGAAGTIAPIVKGLADIKKTRFSKKGKGGGGGGSTGGTISTASLSTGGAAITPDAISDIAANNAARMGIDPSIGGAAGSAAANNVMGGSSGNVVFSENSYSSFQNQVQFKEEKTIIGNITVPN